MNSSAVQQTRDHNTHSGPLSRDLNTHGDQITLSDPEGHAHYSLYEDLGGEKETHKYEDLTLDWKHKHYTHLSEDALSQSSSHGYEMLPALKQPDERQNSLAQGASPLCVTDETQSDTL